MNTQYFIPEVSSKNINPKPEYVCWIDVMGTSNTMSESFEKAVNFILRFHACVMHSIDGAEKISFYPMMDGIYLSSSEWETMKRVITSIYKNISSLFINERINAHRFAIRGALSYGDVFHGVNIGNETCECLAQNDTYKRTMMFGMPIIQAYKSENKSPLFGVYIHESARKVKQLQGRYFYWNRVEQRDFLKGEIETYLNWCNKYHCYLELDPAKIIVYKQLNLEYLSDMNADIQDEGQNNG